MSINCIFYTHFYYLTRVKKFKYGFCHQLELNNLHNLKKGLNYIAGQEPQPLLVLGKRRRRTGSEDVTSAEPMRERKFSFGETSQSGDKKKTPSKPIKTGKASESAKQGIITEETEKMEKVKKDTEKEGTRTRSLSPGKQEKGKVKSSGGTQTASTSTGIDIPMRATLPQAPSMASKTFSSIVKKKHKHKDKTKEKCKLKKLGSKHKHKHHHHKKHKTKGKDGVKKAKKVSDGKQSTKKDGGDAGKNDRGNSTPYGSTPAKKEKVSKPESPFSIVPSSNQQSGDASKSGTDAKKSELTVRIRSNSGDFSHNPFEFHSEDEESSSIAETSTTQSTCQGESIADADSITTSQRDDESVEEEEESEEELEKKVSPAKKAKTSNTPTKKRKERTASSDSKSKIAGEHL